MADICTPCAEKRGGKAGDDCYTAWQGTCTFCNQPGILTDTMDWRLGDDGAPLRRLTQHEVLGRMVGQMVDEEIVAGIKRRRR